MKGWKKPLHTLPSYTETTLWTTSSAVGKRGGTRECAVSERLRSSRIPTGRRKVEEQRREEASRNDSPSQLHLGHSMLWLCEGDEVLIRPNGPLGDTTSRAERESHMSPSLESFSLTSVRQFDNDQTTSRPGGKEEASFCDGEDRKAFGLPEDLYRYDGGERVEDGGSLLALPRQARGEG